MEIQWHQCFFFFNYCCYCLFSLLMVLVPIVLAICNSSVCLIVIRNKVQTYSCKRIWFFPHALLLPFSITYEITSTIKTIHWEVCWTILRHFFSCTSIEYQKINLDHTFSFCWKYLVIFFRTLHHLEGVFLLKGCALMPRLAFTEMWMISLCYSIFWGHPPTFLRFPTYSSFLNLALVNVGTKLID